MIMEILINEIKENLFEKNIDNYYINDYEKWNLIKYFNYSKDSQHKKRTEKDKDDICFISYY